MYEYTDPPVSRWSVCYQRGLPSLVSFPHQLYLFWTVGNGSFNIWFKISLYVTKVISSKAKVLQTASRKSGKILQSPLRALSSLSCMVWPCRVFSGLETQMFTLSKLRWQERNFKWNTGSSSPGPRVPNYKWKLKYVVTFCAQQAGCESMGETME